VQDELTSFILPFSPSNSSSKEAAFVSSGCFCRDAGSAEAHVTTLFACINWIALFRCIDTNAFALADEYIVHAPRPRDDTEINCPS
jgi:hypothetical protein